MLTHLSIKNYALIDTLSINFKDELSIITGETGAGKSILLGALGLALGKRADSSTLNIKEEKCVIEAHFLVSNYELQPFYDLNDLDYEDDTIIRREILPSGKSRSFINDTPTTLKVLADLGEKLIDIHSQHQSLQLSNVNFQFQMIDALAINGLKLTAYRSSLSKFKSLQKNIEHLEEIQKKAVQVHEYNLHLFEELERAQLKIDEQKSIETELDRLNNIETIKLRLSEAQSLAFDEDFGINDKLIRFKSAIGEIASFSKEYAELYDRISSLKIETDDITNEIESLNDSVNSDTSSLERLNDRLQLIYDLQKKHAVSSIAELMVILEDLSDRVSSVEDNRRQILKKKEEFSILKKQLDKISGDIYENRTVTVPRFIEKLEELLSLLGMQNTRFKIPITPTENYFENGKDQLEFYISSNNGIDYGLLKKVASGGELSRIMLSMKFILSGCTKLPTIIFDEIDSGVSGDISQKMADIMFQLSRNIQVISITHLPQIAAKGNHHYKIFKISEGKQVMTRMKLLNNQERIVEIAEMLGSKNITNTAMDHAKQLLN